MAAKLPTDPVLRHVITQPVAGATDDSYMLRQQADFFVQLAIHGLLGCFTAFDAALRELP